MEITDQKTIAIDGIDTKVSVANFLYLSQQPNKNYQEQEHQKIFDELRRSKRLITKNQAQKNYRLEKASDSKKRNSIDDYPFQDVEQEVKNEWQTFRTGNASPGKAVSTRCGGFRKWRKSTKGIQTVQPKGRKNLAKHQRSHKIWNLQFQISRLKVVAYDVTELRSMDSAFVVKLVKYNRGIKYLMVAGDVLSHQPAKKQPEKVWTDKGTEFKGDFKKLCDRKGKGTENAKKDFPFRKGYEQT